jgi:hypothetical protein
MKRYATAVFIAFDVLANAVTGGVKYETLSCRVGLSIMAKGWASHIPWPASWLAHFKAAVHEELV